MRGRRAVLQGIIAVLSLTITSVAFARVSPYGPKGKRFGAGIVLGEPTGITVKGYLTEQVALDLIASWSFVDDAVTLIGDVTCDILDTGSSNAFSAPFYAGAGAKVGFDRKGKNDGRTIVGIRVPVGVALQFARHPVELFFEVGPGIELAPATEVDVTGGAGVRFYF